MSTGDVHSSPVDLTRAPPEISILTRAIENKFMRVISYGDLLLAKS